MSADTAGVIQAKATDKTLSKDATQLAQVVRFFRRSKLAL